MGNDKEIIINRVQRAILKNGGDIVRASEDANVDITFVKQVYTKMKKTLDRDVKHLVADGLMTEIKEGKNSRLSHIVEMLSNLEGRETAMVSECCKATVSIKREKFVCNKCGNECSVKEMFMRDIYYLRLKLLESWREEDIRLIEMAEKLGITNKVTPPQYVQNVRQTVINVGGSSNGKDDEGEVIEISNEQKETLKQIDELPPLEIERIRNELLRKLSETETQQDERRG